MIKINPQRVLITHANTPALPGLTAFAEGLLSVSICMDTDFRQEMAEDVLSGMTGSVKSIPCKYLYDAYGFNFSTGSALPGITPPAPSLRSWIETRT